MGKNYLLIRYEEILKTPKESINEISKFLKTPIKNLEKTLGKIKPSTTVGRWKLHEGRFVELIQYDKKTLEKFRYKN